MYTFAERANRYIENRAMLKICSIEEIQFEND
jgi:hypothetical protein